jgi:hypothetical protein
MNNDLNTRNPNAELATTFVVTRKLPDSIACINARSAARFSGIATLANLMGWLSPS